MIIIETLLTIILFATVDNYRDVPVPELPPETVSYPVDPSDKVFLPCDVCYPIDSGK